MWFFNTTTSRIFPYSCSCASFKSCLRFMSSFPFIYSCILNSRSCLSELLDAFLAYACTSSISLRDKSSCSRNVYCNSLFSERTRSSSSYWRCNMSWRWFKLVPDDAWYLCRSSSCLCTESAWSHWILSSWNRSSCSSRSLLSCDSCSLS